MAAHPIVVELKLAGSITESDVRRLRHEIFGDGVVHRHEAEMLLELNRSVAVRCEGWTRYLVEALTDHLVEQAQPRGHVSAECGNWLIDVLSRQGQAFCPNEIELLVRVLDRAQSAPEHLSSFALARVIDLAGAPDGDRKPFMSEAEVELVRRVLYAFGGEAGASISRAEAEALFELNERTDPAANHPAWRELFVKAIANYLMAAATYRAPSRMAALAREEWLENSETDIKTMLAGAVSGLGQLFSGAFLDELEDAHQQIERAWAERNARVEAQAAEAEIVTGDEAKWLIDRLLRDGKVDATEKALMAFLKRESPEIDPLLQPWFDKISAAG